MPSSISPSHVALVTGSGKQRIGRGVAEALAQRGYRIAVHYHCSEKDANDAVTELGRRGTEAIAVHADVGDESAVRQMISEVIQRFGRLDVLVNCASLYQPKRFEDVTATDLINHFRANLLGTFLCCQHAGLTMVGQAEGGSIVNFGDWALERPYVDHSAYFATKGAIPAMTRCLAVELGLRNPRVRVNYISPGPILFPADMPQEERERAVQSTVLKRQGQPEDIDRAVLFLVGDGYVTGACVTVDGGRTIYARDE